MGVCVNGFYTYMYETIFYFSQRFVKQVKLANQNIHLRYFYHVQRRSSQVLELKVVTIEINLKSSNLEEKFCLGNSSHSMESDHIKNLVN